MIGLWVYSNSLLIIIRQILLRNALFPPCLRFSIWVLGKLGKKVGGNSDYLLMNAGKKVGGNSLRRSWCLVATVVGFLVAPVVLFLAMEWNSEYLNGMNSFEKIVGVLFQSVNARHAGETIVDISTVSAAILVLATVCMSVSLSLSTCPSFSLIPTNHRLQPIITNTIN
ncbi:hypothetical protein V6N13_068642 [Hibiscus sabdariffa]